MAPHHRRYISGGRFTKLDAVGWCHNVVAFCALQSMHPSGGVDTTAGIIRNPNFAFRDSYAPAARVQPRHAGFGCAHIVKRSCDCSILDANCDLQKLHAKHAIAARVQRFVRARWSYGLPFSACSMACRTKGGVDVGLKPWKCFTMRPSFEITKLCGMTERP